MILRFKQLGGARKTLELADHAAPFGRPRVGPVANDKITLRENEVRIAGTDIPVRHLHGLKHGDWELHGRFSDYWGLAGFAQAKTAEVKRFVADQQPVRVTWGETLAGVGLITEFDPGRESETETDWKMTVKIDSDDLIEKRFDVATQARPRSDIDRIMRFANETRKAFEGMKLKGDIFDLVNGLISSFANLTAGAIAIANEIHSYETSAIGSVRRFRAMLGQLKTAAISIRDTIDSIPVDLAIEAHNANERFGFLNGQAIMSDSALSIIIEASKADRSAQIAERGKVLDIYTARGGDTFESMASRYYGSAGRAEDIRSANGVGSGQAPEVGAIYVIPI